MNARLLRLATDRGLAFRRIAVDGALIEVIGRKHLGGFVGRVRLPPLHGKVQLFDTANPFNGGAWADAPGWSRRADLRSALAEAA